MSPLPLEPSPAVFVTCQIGAEPALVAEMGKVMRRLKPAFRRPGFVTFKGETVVTPEELEKIASLPLVRRAAYSLGKEPPFEELAARDVPVHVFSRLEHQGGAPAEQEAMKERLQALEKKAGGASAKFKNKNDVPKIIDVIEVDPDQIWWGFHERTGAFGEELRGGLCEGEGTREVPSRAYWKCYWLMRLAESLGVKLAPGERALEIGAAPGGAVLALAEGGLKVIGVDRAALDPNLLWHFKETVVHLSVSADELDLAELWERGGEPMVDWILIDIHAEPLTALGVIRRLIDRGLHIREGGILTFKLNQWGFYKNRIQWERVLNEMGFLGVKMVQLSVHHQELGVIVSKKPFLGV